MKRIHYLIISVLVVLLDAWTKWPISSRLALHDTVTVIPNLFELVHVRNSGAAFGIGANAESAVVPLLLNAGAIAVFFIVVVYALRTAVTDRVLQTALHLILGGAIGNLIDRFRYRYVVDFLDFFVSFGGREHHWPAFNVADSAICIGIALLFLDMKKKPEADTEPAESVAS